MTRNASEAAQGAGSISENIGGVAQAADGTSAKAQESQKAAQELSTIARELSQLMAQFKIERRDRRIEIALPVRLIATDPPLDENVTTINISHGGALLRGIRGQLHLGDKVSLVHANKQG